MHRTSIRFKKISLFLAAFLMIGFLTTEHAFASLSCSITTAAACTTPNVIVLRMASSTNSHSELPSQSTAAYANNVICCAGSTGMTNSCSGTFAVVARLARPTNSHVEEGTFSNYSNLACLAVPNGTITIGYQSTNCTGFDTTVASMSSTSNAHIGDASSYPLKICGTTVPAPQALSFSLSNTSIGFGTLTSFGTRYASSDLLGSSSEVEAHKLVVNTNAASGYTVTVQGATLSSVGNTINPIGGVATSSLVGTNQFGLHLLASGGTGSVTAPYNSTGFAYAADAFTPSTVASDSVGDSATTTYSVRYIANINQTAAAGSYSANIQYTVTANF